MNSRNTHLYKKYRKKVKRKLPPVLVQLCKNMIALTVLFAKRYLINRNGKKLQEVFKDLDAQDYVRVTGKGANLNFEVVMQELYNFTNIHKQIESLHYIDGRRWDVKLKNNIIIKLPETNIYEAAALFEENFGKISKLYKTCVVDLRLIPDKIYLKVIN